MRYLLGVFVYLFSCFLFFVDASNIWNTPDSFLVEISPDKVEAKQDITLIVSAIKNWKVMNNYHWIILIHVEENGNILSEKEVPLPNWWWIEFGADNKWKLTYNDCLSLPRKWTFSIVVEDFYDDAIIGKIDVTTYAEASWIKQLTTFSQEVIDAYNWAYGLWITTQTIDKANLWWQLTRQAMAKMIVVFSKDILWKKPDPSIICNFEDVDKSTTLGQYMIEACQLWLMWQNAQNFNPMWVLNRAQFWTILSRALWWGANEGWNPYYSKHLEKLKFSWIMEKISTPEARNEMRGYVMLMMKRAAETLKK